MGSGRHLERLRPGRKCHRPAADAHPDCHPGEDSGPGYQWQQVIELEYRQLVGKCCSMILDQIRSRLQNGFRPFTICLSDGRKFTVPQRDFIALGSKVVVVIDEHEISHTINPVHVVSITEATLTQ